MSKIGHEAVDMEEAIMKTLNYSELEMNNCRGQSFDNTSNMSGIHSGLQQRIKERNSLAFYIPCTAHSLNLVGSCVASVASVQQNFLCL